MEDEKFTLGPWKYNKETRTEMSSISGETGFVCIGMGGMRKKMSDADLALTLAGPKIYSALKSWYDGYNGCDGDFVTPKMIRDTESALKEARGEV